MALPGGSQLGTEVHGSGGTDSPGVWNLGVDFTSPAAKS
jgi:hypothetical protein